MNSFRSNGLGKKVGFISVLCVVVLLGFFWWKQSHPNLASANSMDAERSTVARQTLFEKAKESSGLAQAKLSHEEVSSACAPALEAIETMSLQTLQADLVSGNLKLDPSCLNIPTGGPFLQGFPQVCESRQDGQPTQECLSKLFYYKALRIYEATSGQSATELSVDILVQKLMGLLVGTKNIAGKDAAQLREIGLELHRRLPDSASAAKAAALGYLVSMENLTPEDSANFRDLMQEVRGQFPEDWDIFEIAIVQKKAQSPEEFNKEVQAYYKANPDSSIAQYYMGCMSWSSNDAVIARKYFKQAWDSASQNKRFQETYEKSLKAAPPDSVCSLQIGFNPEQF